ncbi:MAG: hypothetical protein ACK5NT_00850 [Pyrinomonadaceae bacterium]
MKNLLLIVLLFVGFAGFANGQNLAELDKSLAADAKKVSDYSTYSGNYDDAKSIDANNVLEAKLLDVASNADSLTYSFPNLSKQILIASSEDKKLRVYSWDSGLGGTMHDYFKVFQFIGNNGEINAYSMTNSEEGGAGSFVLDIFTVNGKNETLYLLTSTFIGSTRDHLGDVTAYRIVNNQLEKAKVFNTKEGLKENISFEYDALSVVNRPERPVQLIKYNGKTKTVRIPLVVEDKEFPLGRVTDRFLNYRFDGKTFRFKNK